MIEQHHTFSHVHAMNKAGLNILNRISHSVRSYWRCAGFALLPARPGLSAIAGPGVSRKRTSGLCLVPLEYLQHASGLFTSTNCSSKSPERRMVIMDTLCSHYFTRNTHTHMHYALYKHMRTFPHGALNPKSSHSLKHSPSLPLSFHWPPHDPAACLRSRRPVLLHILHQPSNTRHICNYNSPHHLSTDLSRQQKQAAEKQTPKGGCETHNDTQ